MATTRQQGMRFTVQQYHTLPMTELSDLEDRNNKGDHLLHSVTHEEEWNQNDGTPIAHRRPEILQLNDHIQDAVVCNNNNEVIKGFFEGAGHASLARDGNGAPMTNVPDYLSDASPSTLIEVANISSRVADRGRKFAERQRRRLVFKDGSCNISSGNVTKRNRKYLVDIFTTLVDMKWRYNLLMFTLAFVISWVLFAVVWYVIAVAHGDHLHPEDTENWKPCVDNVYDFVTALLFSIETQHTIGYGFRAMTPRCPEAVVFLMIQSCTGVFVQCLMTGLIFAKLSQPKRRAHTIMFSQKAVISKQEGEYCLMFRVGDMRKSHFVGTSIRALMVRDRVTKEGESTPLCQFPLDIQTEEACPGDNFVFLVWPVTVLHRINDRSPLWTVSAEELVSERFEIIVILEGIVESTGMTTQVRTSYLPSEILWGHNLAPLLTYQKENGQYKIDYTQFHSVISNSSMPECSARDLAERSSSAVDPLDLDSPSAVYFTSPVGLMRPSSRRVAAMIGKMRGSLRPRKLRQGKSKEEKDSSKEEDPQRVENWL